MDALILGLRVVVALGAVLGLMWFLQHRLGNGTGRRRADRALTMVNRQRLGQKPPWWAPWPPKPSPRNTLCSRTNASSTFGPP